MICKRSPGRNYSSHGKKQESSHNEETFYYLQFLRATNIYIYINFFCVLSDAKAVVGGQPAGHSYSNAYPNNYFALFCDNCCCFIFTFFYHYFFSLLIYVQYSSLPGVSFLGGAIVAIVRIRTNPDPDD